METLEDIQHAISNGDIKEYRRNFNPILLGNWLPYKPRKDLVALFTQLSEDQFFKSHPLYLIVPFSSVCELSEKGNPSGIVAGTTGMFNVDEGSYQEKIAVKMLHGSLCRFVVVDATGKKGNVGLSLDHIRTLIHKLLDDKVMVFICLGESQSEYLEGNALEVLKQQITQTVEGLPDEALSNLGLIYSPSWITALGSSKLSENMENSYHVFRHILEEILGSDRSSKIRVCLSIPRFSGDSLQYFKNTQFDGFYFPNLALQKDCFLKTLESVKSELPDWLEAKCLVKDLSSDKIEGLEFEDFETESVTEIPAGEIPAIEEVPVVAEAVEEEEEISAAPPQSTFVVGDITSWGSSEKETDLEM